LAGAALAQDQRFNETQRRRIHALHWEGVLAFLLNPHASVFSLPRLLSEVGGYVAQRLGLTQEVYRSSLQKIASAKETLELRYAPLAQLLHADAKLVPATEEEAALPAAALDNTKAQAVEVEYLIDDETLALDGDPLWLLQYLVQFGVMPAGSAPSRRAMLMTHLGVLLNSHSPDLLRLALWAAGSELMRLRLVRLLTPDLLRRLVMLLLPAHADALMACMEAWPRALAKLVSGYRGTEEAADDLLHAIYVQRYQGFELALYLRDALRQQADRHALEMLSLADAWRVEILHQPRHVDVLPVLEAVTRELEFEILRFEPAHRVAIDKPVRRPMEKKLEPEIEQLPVAESFYVDNAGVVLLWPFLQRYFQMLDLMDGKVFAGFAQQCRAAHLLQYLVSGTIEASEHTLLLNKIVCGIKTALPLEVGGPLSESEKQVSEQLLHGVTQNWGQLKNTSIEGLRETFLMREGRLVRKEDDWTLTVSGKSFDVLLRTLPWAISTIRLSWMEGVLWVQWK
jgi:hypothetical protein